MLRIIRTPIEIYRRSIEDISIDPLRPAATRYDPHGSVLTVQFSRFGSHGSCLTVRFTRNGSHSSVRTVRFHDTMPLINAPFSLERFGSHGFVHTGRREIENRKSKVSPMCEFGIYCFLQAFSVGVDHIRKTRSDPLRPAQARYDPLRPAMARYDPLRPATTR